MAFYHQMVVAVAIHQFPVVADDVRTDIHHQ